MLPDVASPGEWLHPKVVAAVAEHLLANMQFDQPRSALESDITRALQDSDLIEFEWSTEVDTVCELLGTYTRRPARIRVARRQRTARANFTAAHEFGHHLQQQDEDWAMELADLRRAHGSLMRHVEEAVSNHVAVLLLMPDHVVETAWTGTLTPAFVRALTRDGLVSRQAASMRASRWARADDPNAVLVVADPTTGLVLSSESADASTLARPPKGSVQSDFRALTAGAQGTRAATDGFVYSTNTSRSDIAYDWGWDADGTHIFVVARPTYRFGDALWSRDELECASASCESTFAREGAVLCRTCMLHRCPDCGSCGCEKRRGATCENCGFEMSVRESQLGSAHEECPF
ncbi:ImmA/IrrE family metallo-endopeptidase [Microbacterium sp. NPDC087589]|uniref:ImmA/IrrE family metallo-endopeptidase n=1 Tax=Microbacterium sp. NPDC087589 TaxID=3364191 RepID=UPI0038306A23